MNTEKQLELEKEVALLKAQLKESQQQHLGMLHNIRNTITNGMHIPSERILREVSKEVPDKNELYENAMNLVHCSNTLRAYTNNALLSYSGKPQDWLLDVENQKTVKGVKLIDLLLYSLRTVVVNMLDRKYFQQAADRYYSDNEIWAKSRQAFIDLPSDDLQGLKKYMSTFLIDRAHISVSGNLHNFIIGSEHQSCWRFQVLLEEILLNAFKAMAACDKENRILIIDLRLGKKFLNGYFSNSFRRTDDFLRQGIGTEVINRIMDNLGGELSQEFDGESNAVSITEIKLKV